MCEEMDCKEELYEDKEVIDKGTHTYKYTSLLNAYTYERKHTHARALASACVCNIVCRFRLL